MPLLTKHNDMILFLESKADAFLVLHFISPLK